MGLLGIGAFLVPLSPEDTHLVAAAAAATKAQSSAGSGVGGRAPPERAEVGPRTVVLATHDSQPVGGSPRGCAPAQASHSPKASVQRNIGEELSESAPAKPMNPTRWGPRRSSNVGSGSAKTAAAAASPEPQKLVTQVVVTIAAVGAKFLGEGMMQPIDRDGNKQAKLIEMADGARHGRWGGHDGTKKILSAHRVIESKLFLDSLSTALVWCGLPFPAACQSVLCFPDPDREHQQGNRRGLNHLGMSARILSNMVQSSYWDASIFEAHQQLMQLIQQAEQTGRREVTYAVVCRSGRHRSVAFAWLLSKILPQVGIRCGNLVFTAQHTWPRATCNMCEECKFGNNEIKELSVNVAVATWQAADRNWSGP